MSNAETSRRTKKTFFNHVTTQLPCALMVAAAFLTRRIDEAQKSLNFTEKEYRYV